jgi:hypothetical protein
MAALLEDEAAILVIRRRGELRLLRSNSRAMWQCNRDILSKVRRHFALASVASNAACG